MTNNVQAAELVPGWLPVYGTDTLAELDPGFGKAETEIDRIIKATT